MSPGNAVMHYSIPVRDDSRLSGKDAKELALHGIILPTAKNGGAEGIRTPDPLNAIEVLSQLSYSPT